MPAKKSTKKVAAKKSAVKSAPAKKASVAKKVAAKPAPKKVAPSLDAIAKAAYLNYRLRTEQGLPGDNDSDWHEAERSVTNG